MKKLDFHNMSRWVVNSPLRHNQKSSARHNKDAQNILTHGKLSCTMTSSSDWSKHLYIIPAHPFNNNVFDQCQPNSLIIVLSFRIFFLNQTMHQKKMVEPKKTLAIAGPNKGNLFITSVKSNLKKWSSPKNHWTKQDQTKETFWLHLLNVT